MRNPETVVDGIIYHTWMIGGLKAVDLVQENIRQSIEEFKLLQKDPTFNGAMEALHDADAAFEEFRRVHKDTLAAFGDKSPLAVAATEKEQLTEIITELMGKDEVERIKNLAAEGRDEQRGGGDIPS